MRRTTWGVLALLLSCNGDDGGAAGAGTAEDGSDGADATVSPDDGGDDGADSTAADDGNDDSTTPCGNGLVDSGEECDDGEANSDTTPDACRQDCRLPQCSDGVVDTAAGEECDDGGNNANFEADACRTNCLLPRCGDGGVDTGEACDDGNEDWGDSCFECSRRFYFILNAPDMTSGGTVSIVRTTRSGPALQLVGDDANYDGIWQLAVEPTGSTLYALQSSGDTHRVLSFDGGTGDLVSEADIGMAALGYEPTPRGIVRASDGLIYVALTGGGSTRLVSIDPAVGEPTEAIDFGGTFDVVDMTHDLAEGIYISTGPGNTIMRADISDSTTATFADASDGLANPGGIIYDPGSQLISVANNPTPTAILQSDLAGNFEVFTTAKANIGDAVPALAIDIGGVVTAPVPGQDRIVGIGVLGGVQDIFTDMVAAPIDLEILELLDTPR